VVEITRAAKLLRREGSWLTAGSFIGASMSMSSNEYQMRVMSCREVEQDSRDVSVEMDETRGEERRRSTPAKQVRCAGHIRAGETKVDHRQTRKSSWNKKETSIGPERRARAAGEASVRLSGARE
jgi:hypothetical protein